MGSKELVDLTYIPGKVRASRGPGRRDGREERRRSGDVVLACELLRSQQRKGLYCFLLSVEKGFPL